MQSKQPGLEASSIRSAGMQAPPPEPAQAFCTASRSDGRQLVPFVGGDVKTPGLQPGYGAGQVAPRTPHAPAWQTRFCEVQFSQSAPKLPQFAGPLPGRQAPSAAQQPAQVSGPQCGPL